MSPENETEFGRLRANLRLAAQSPDPELRQATWELIDELEAIRWRHDPRFDAPDRPRRNRHAPSDEENP